MIRRTNRDLDFSVCYTLYDSAGLQSRYDTLFFIFQIKFGASLCCHISVVDATHYNKNNERMTGGKATGMF